MRLLEYQRVLLSEYLETKQLPELQSPALQDLRSNEKPQQNAAPYWAELFIRSRDLELSVCSPTSSSSVTSSLFVFAAPHNLQYHV